MTTLTDDDFLAELRIPTGGELLDAIRAGARDAFADHLHDITDQDTHMTTTTPTPLDADLGDRLRRLAPWADRTPPIHQTAVAVAIDRLAVLLGLVVEDAPDDELEDEQ